MDRMEKVIMNKKMAIDEVMKITEDCIKSHNLEIKLTSAEYISDADNIKLRYYFTAESRIDLRELVKDLIGIFKMRIEFRQV